MSESGGRRIKRSLQIDLRTIQFADETLLERFKRIRILRPYLEGKLDDIQKHNSDVGDDLSELINGAARRQHAAQRRPHRRDDDHLSIDAIMFRPKS